MKQKESRTAPLLGGSSLLSIFGVLCLTVFALLSLTTVTARQRLSDGALAAVSAYYEADTQAEIIFARLRGGEIPEGVTQTGDIYSYECTITENRSLFVQLQRNGENWTVLGWQEVAEPLPIDDALPVWDGK